MSGPSAQKRLSIRHSIIQETVHEWIQTLPWPHYQQVAMRESALVSAINLEVELLIEAAYKTVKEER